MQPLSASSWTWKHNDNLGDIIAYRVVEPKYRPFANAAEFEKDCVTIKIMIQCERPK
jgi:hypothetical protein